MQKVLLKLLLVSQMVEDVRIELRLLLPGQACYHYTTSSIWWSRGESNPCPKFLHKQDLLTHYTVFQRCLTAGACDLPSIWPRAYQFGTPPPPCSNGNKEANKPVPIFDLRRLPIQTGCVVLEDSHRSGSSPLSHKSSESGVDHNDSLSVVVSFLVKP